MPTIFYSIRQERDKTNCQIGKYKVLQHANERYKAELGKASNKGTLIGLYKVTGPDKTLSTLRKTFISAF